MHLQTAIEKAFTQLSESLDMLTGEQYNRPCQHLSKSSVGQHVRHVIEMFQCLETGYESGVVNYEKRERDAAIETDRTLAQRLLKEINNNVSRPDKLLALEGAYVDDGDNTIRLSTNYYREVLYNLEHTIHHMALIRVALKELKDIDMPESFGVAPATVKHRKACAQ